MANFTSTRLQRGYVVAETTWGQAVAPTDTDAYLFIDLDIQDAQSVEDRPDKTGSLSRVVGQRTRRNGTWSTRLSLAGGGAAGTPPDIDPFLAALMGKAGTVSAGTSVTYDLDDNESSVTIWDFNRPGTINQRAAPGAIVMRMNVRFGQTFAEVTFSGEAKCVLGSNTFSVESTEAKSGLTSFPTEPTSPSVVGATLASVATGYKGVITLDGNAYATVREGEFEMTVDRELQKQTWNDDLPTGIMQGVRTVRITRLALDDDDSANLTALIQKAYGSTEVDFSLQIGTVAGGTYTFNFKNIVLPKPQYDYSQKRRGIIFNNPQAAASNITSKDEFQIVVA